MEFAVLLAMITLDESIIDSIIEEAEPMLTLEQKRRALEELTERFGETAYERSVRKKSREEGLIQVLSAQLRERFGDHPGATAVAERLAGWPDVTVAVHAIATADRLEDVPDAQPSA